MKKHINKDLNLYFTNNYPYKIKRKIVQKYSAVLGIGGNVGDVKLCFNLLFKMFQNSSKITILQSSPILKNPPFGYEAQDYFLNALIEVSTTLNPTDLLKLCWYYEKRFKRIRSFKDAPRTLDIDIIFIKKYDKNIKISTKKLTIPHIGYKKRDSVVIPLSYII
jgi:2-amino-4-hydroxy-6-hydroxymethyldihydropteridine diphosphokinase